MNSKVVLLTAIPHGTGSTQEHFLVVVAPIVVCEYESWARALFWPEGISCSRAEETAMGIQGVGSMFGLYKGKACVVLSPVDD